MGAADGSSRDLNLRKMRQPYYVCIGEHAPRSAQTNLLHQLCNALNSLGYEAYVDTIDSSGELWTPVLTEATRIAHYRSGKKPIVVSGSTQVRALDGMGMPVKFFQHSHVNLASKVAEFGGHCYLQSVTAVAPWKALFVPALHTDLLNQLCPLAPEVRVGSAYLNQQYLAAGGKIHNFGSDAIDLTTDDLSTHEAICEVLCRVRCLYAYEDSVYSDWARLCGCPVVMMPNAFTLQAIPPHLVGSQKKGIAWGDSAEEVSWAYSTVSQWRSQYLHDSASSRASLQVFVQETQVAAQLLSLAEAWPQEVVDRLPLKDVSEQVQGERADRQKYRRINEQFVRWSKHCSIREVDADIYAEHLAAGRVPACTLLIDHRGTAMDALADTLDSVGECLAQPASVVIISDKTAPDALDTQSGLTWITASHVEGATWAGQLPPLTDWTLLVQSGTRLAPQSLVEWGLSTHSFAQAQLIYADDAIWQGDLAAQYPFFKPDANVELLRSTNYLGAAVLVRTASWVQAGYPLFDGGLYRYSLGLVGQQGRVALGHIDTVLVYAGGGVPPGLEQAEFQACSSWLKASGLAQTLRPLDRVGTWLVEYASAIDVNVTMVVPTGIQTGYLRTLLESLVRYPQSALAEVVLVCQPEQLDEVHYVLGGLQINQPVRVIELAQEIYNHAAALNAGVAAAEHPYILVADDDTEALHSNWLTPLLGIAQQSDVGCVAPRLMSNRGSDARISGGPLVLGVQGTAAAYNGESGLLSECGAQSRLHLTQDVSAVAGNFFLFRKTDWAALGGFDVPTFGIWYSVLDFCLRLGQLGKRHVWTPLTSVLHQGGKTVEARMRDMRTKLRLAESDLAERDALLRVWAQQLATDPCYNRHLSLFNPYDVEQTIVVDWQPRRKDRPRVLACPLTSGAGQYRVVEPMNALQDASLAQTCAIIPIKHREIRVLQPLELVRAAPDRLILQHSVDDGQLGMIEKYRLAMPNIQIVQMVDDLLGEVPEKHPNRNFQVREGHQRMIRALKQSNRLVVTTEPLRQHYKKYVSDVWLIPNCMDKQWADLRRPKPARTRLRVGWVGAGQHKGDLDLVAALVKELAAEVDWVFMGMCTDEIKPYIKEFHSFVSIADYPRKMASLDLDIAIAPLEQNFFNECKSNLRLLEYGAMGWPVVCSDVFPYRSYDPPVLRCGNDVAEWLHALRSLMCDEAMRLSMGEQLHQWVQANFLLKNKARDWMRAVFDASVAHN